MRLKTSPTLLRDETISLIFMKYIASDESRMSRFCGLTGIDHAGLVNQLADSSFQAFLLDYALGDESLLMAFCAEAGIRPQDVQTARRMLPGAIE